MTVMLNQLQGISGRAKVVTSHGEKVGGIGQIYLDDRSGEPEWVTVKTGLFGTAESFVPLQGARIENDSIVVNYDKDTIKAAPRVDADGSLSPQEEQSLYRHYGLAGADESPAAAGYPSGGGQVSAREGGDDVPSDLDDPAEAGDDRPDISERTTGYDRSGPTTDTAMTRSEERARVGTQTQVAGRARLRKYVVTENVTQTVPVNRERVRVEREPISEENRAAAMSGPAISEEEHEVVLHDEVPVVGKETVPVERVRMDKTTVSGEETVATDVRKEQIEVDNPQPKTPGSRH